MRKEPYLRFRANDGNEYLYNYVENRIYFLNECLKKVIFLYNTCSLNEIYTFLKPKFFKRIYNYKIVQRFENEKNFLKELYEKITSEKDKISPRLSIEDFIKEISNVRQLKLEITQACNFRCKYCIYSGHISIIELMGIK